MTDDSLSLAIELRADPSNDCHLWSTVLQDFGKPVTIRGIGTASVLQLISLTAEDAVFTIFVHLTVSRALYTSYCISSLAVSYKGLFIHV